MLSSAALLAAVVAIGCAGESTSQASPSAATLERTASPESAMADLRRIVRERVDAEGSTGIVAGMVFPGGTTRTVAYGDAGRGKRLNEKSVFEIGSVTKVFTGTLLAEMVRRGEVALTDPVEDLLPPDVSVPNFEGREITLEDLATQTSGLPSLPASFAPADPGNPYADYTVDDLYEFLGGYTLTRSPGSQYEYSNLGVGLLGHALALRAGTGYEDLLRERVLTPLEMDETGIVLGPKARRRFVAGHDADGRVTPAWDLPTIAGAGALRSSITDMLDFASANLDETEGPLAEAVAAAHQPRRTVDAETEIGLNWHVLSTDDREIVWHNGGTGGFSTFIGFDLERQVAIVVLSNSQQSIDDIGFHALDESIPLVKPPRVIDVDPKVLDRYVGTYDLAGARLRITRSRAGLSVEVPAEGEWQLYAETRRRFFLKAIAAQVTFKLSSKGDVTGFELLQEGQAIAAEKVR